MNCACGMLAQKEERENEVKEGESEGRKERKKEEKGKFYFKTSCKRPNYAVQSTEVQCIIPYKDQNYAVQSTEYSVFFRTKTKIPISSTISKCFMCMLQFPCEHQGNATKVSSPLLLSLHTERRTNRMQNPLIQCTPIVQQCIPLRKRKTSKIPSSSREKSSRTDNGTATMQYHHRCRPHPRGKGQATSHKQRVRGSGS